MKRPAVIVLGVVLVLCVWFVRQQPRHDRPQNPQSSTDALAAKTAVSTVPSLQSPGQSTPLLGESILRDYANTNQPPENDLTLMSRLMENSLLLLKAAGNRPLSANEDWADLLRGKNFAQERFISDTNVALNAQGQLVDRWSTPIFFHALGNGRYEIRSAGPDKTLWTADDVHRNADGSFRRGTDLDSPSLMETATRGRSPSTAP